MLAIAAIQQDEVCVVVFEIGSVEFRRERYLFDGVYKRFNLLVRT